MYKFIMSFIPSAIMLWIMFFTLIVFKIRKKADIKIIVWETVALLVFILLWMVGRNL